MITQNIKIFNEAVKKHQSLLAIDYGIRKSGIAISIYVNNTTICMPFCTIYQFDLIKLVKKITEITQQKNIEGFVVGLPTLFYNKKSKIEKNIKTLSEKLSQIKPVFLYDESFSTKDAVEKLHQYGFSEKNVQKLDDQVAASIILEEVTNQMS